METMRQRFAAVTTELLDADSELAVVLADIGVGGFVETGAFSRHADRIVNVGIREQLMVGVGAGLALEGMRPVIHTYAPFLVERAYEQIKLDLGHQGVGAVLVTVGASYDTSAGGRTHHAPADVGLIGALPGWQIEVPGHPDEVEAVLRRAAADAGRVYIRLAADANTRPVTVRCNGMNVVRRGSHGAPTMVAVGPMLDRVVAATHGLDVTVVYAVTVRPFDAATLRRAATGSEVVIVEPYLAGTSAAAVAEALAGLPHRTLALGVPNVELRRYGSRREHDAAHGLDVAGIRRSILGFLEGAAQPCFGAAQPCFGAAV